MYSGVTSGITLAMLFLGGVSDKIGVRARPEPGLLHVLVGPVLIALSGTLPLGHGVGSPMFFMTVAGPSDHGRRLRAVPAGRLRRGQALHHTKTAAMGYAVVYGLMNLGAFFSGFISPFVRKDSPRRPASQRPGGRVLGLRRHDGRRPAGDHVRS